jgi:hypothetical protein
MLHWAILEGWGTMVRFGIWLELYVKLPFGIANNATGQNGVAVIL